VSGEPFLAAPSNAAIAAPDSGLTHRYAADFIAIAIASRQLFKCV
jgi:hypothetical protein